MNPQTIIYLIGFFSVLMWIFQVIALADPSSIMKHKPGYDGHCHCGLFSCVCGAAGLAGHSCGDFVDHIKAAQAFGVMAVLLLSLSMIIHVMLCFNKTTSMLLGNQYTGKLVDYMWVVHLVSAVFNLICWACIAGAYDRSFCGGTTHFKSWFTLTYGFGFLIINTVFDAVLAYICWMYMHVGGGGGRGGGGGGGKSAPGYYESNPIDRQHFQRRR